MPAKKKHNKGKGTFKSKQRRPERKVQEPAISRTKTAGIAVQAPPVAVTPVAAATAAVAPKQAPGPRAMPAKFNYLNITKELRSIAILFVIVLVLMVAVALLFR